MSIRTLLSPDSLVLALVGVADPDRLSAQLWPLDLALARLADAAPEGGELARVIARMPQSQRGIGLRFTGVRRSIHALVAMQLLTPGGQGWAAGYAVSADLIERGRLLAAALDDEERLALEAAGQALVAATSMASKSPATSLPTGS